MWIGVSAWASYDMIYAIARDWGDRRGSLEVSDPSELNPFDGTWPYKRRMLAPVALPVGVNSHLHTAIGRYVALPECYENLPLHSIA